MCQTLADVVLWGQTEPLLCQRCGGRLWDPLHLHAGHREGPG